MEWIWNLQEMKDCNWWYQFFNHDVIYLHFTTQRQVFDEANKIVNGIIISADFAWILSLQFVE